MYRYVGVVQHLATQWIQSYPCKTKTSQKRKRAYKRSRSCRGTKSHLRWQFHGIWQVLWRSLLESLHVNTAQIRNKLDCWKSSAQSERRDICCIVAIRSGWEMVGRFYGVLLTSTKHSRSLIWWVNTMWKAVRNAFWRTSDPVRSNGRTPPISAKDLSRLHQFGPNVLPGIFHGYALHAVRIWTGGILVADLEKMDASEIYAKRLSAKEVKSSYFQSQMER